MTWPLEVYLVTGAWWFGVLAILNLVWYCEFTSEPRLVALWILGTPLWPLLAAAGLSYAFVRGTAPACRCLVRGCLDLYADARELLTARRAKLPVAVVVPKETP